MAQRPNAVALLLCEQTIVEEKTHNVTPINQFFRRRVAYFPSPPLTFTVFAILTDGQGRNAMKVQVTHLATMEDLYTRSWQMTFRDPLAQVRVMLRVRDCSFPAPGLYQVSLNGNNELIAQCTFQLLEAETES